MQWVSWNLLKSLSSPASFPKHQSILWINPPLVGNFVGDQSARTYPLPNRPGPHLQKFGNLIRG
jgi:hypothetical protein